ncbi:hypothetical protein ACPVPU_01290 [Sphingomonas sp. CJ99]
MAIDSRAKPVVVRYRLDGGPERHAVPGDTIAGGFVLLSFADTAVTISDGNTAYDVRLPMPTWIQEDNAPDAAAVF